MKTLRVGGLLLLVCLGLGLITLRFTGLEPRGNRPGLWLPGELVTNPVTDWAFSDQFQEIHVETRTWYRIPHSVTTNCVAYNGRLYLTSTYSSGGEFPRARSWNQNVVRDPRVRLQIGNQLFDRTLSLVTDRAEKEGVIQSKGKKYPQWKNPGTDNVYIFRVS